MEENGLRHRNWGKGQLFTQDEASLRQLAYLVTLNRQSSASKMVTRLQKKTEPVPAQRIDNRQRKKKLRTLGLIYAAQKCISDDHFVPIRLLANTFLANGATVYRVFHEDVRYTAGVIKVRPMIFEANKIKMISAGNRLQFISAEKIFTFDSDMSRRNNRWFADDSENASVLGRKIIYGQRACSASRYTASSSFEKPKSLIEKFIFVF